MAVFSHPIGFFSCSSKRAPPEIEKGRQDYQRVFEANDSALFATKQVERIIPDPAQITLLAVPEKGTGLFLLPFSGCQNITLEKGQLETGEVFYGRDPAGRAGASDDGPVQIDVSPSSHQPP